VGIKAVAPNLAFIAQATYLRAFGGFAVVIAGEFDGGRSAFLVVKHEDGEERFFELEWFSALSVHHKQKNVHIGIFTGYNQFPRVLHADYCMPYPKDKLRLLALEEKPFPPVDEDTTTAREETA
jgi:hypothetical protein